MTTGWWWLGVGQAAVAGWLMAAPSPAAGRLVRARSTPSEDGPDVRVPGSLEPATGRVLDRWRAGRTTPARRAALGDLLAAVAAELRTGAAPREVLARAAAEVGLAEVAAAARHPAGDPVAALEQLATRPGGSVAADLAALWRVSELTGCSLVVPVSRLLAGHRTDDRLRRQVDAVLAGPRTTGRLLALLPAAGLALGLSLGADPVAFLLGTPTGLACLAGGTVLAGLGATWSRAIVRSALPPSGS